MMTDFVGLTDPDLRKRVEHDGGFFVAEGPLVVRTLLASTYRVRSVLVTPAQRAALADVLDPLDAPVHVVTPEVMRETVGFDLHRGALASADRAPLPALETVLAGAARVAVLEQVNDHENLGALFRNAAAFGFDAVLLCPQCSDPLYRRTVRVSIGHVLHVPWTRAAPWPEVLDDLHALGFRRLALDAEPTGAAARRDRRGRGRAGRRARRRGGARSQRRRARAGRRTGPGSDGARRRLAQRRGGRGTRLRPPGPARRPLLSPAVARPSPTCPFA